MDIDRTIIVAKAPWTWGFFGSLGVALLAYLAYEYSVIFVLLVMVIFDQVPITASTETVQALAGQWYWQFAIWITEYALTLATIWIAVRSTKRPFAEYLALIWPSWRELGYALGAMFVVLHLLSLIGWWINEPGDAGVVATYLDARSRGDLFYLLVTLCIAAPVAEELVVRGFLFRGWSESFLGLTGTIVVSSALWAVTHTQYDWFGVFSIFVIGLVLGVFRYRSGSTLLGVVVHSAISLYVCFGLAWTLPLT